MIIKNILSWLGNNWFKVIVIFILVITIVSGFLFFIAKGNKQEERELSLLKERHKADCLEIYKVEIGKWNNVNGWNYDEFRDSCYIEYKDSPKKTELQCDTQYKGENEKVPIPLIVDWLLCKDGLFRKSF
ncbi:MAG: hypothetical protein WC537_02650 [Candidatus Paceibacterota bacterium]